jgi:hypothetical protein
LPLRPLKDRARRTGKNVRISRSIVLTFVGSRRKARMKWRRAPAISPARIASKPSYPRAAA